MRVFVHFPLVPFFSTQHAYCAFTGAETQQGNHYCYVKIDFKNLHGYLITAAHIAADTVHFSHEINISIEIKSCYNTEL